MNIKNWNLDIENKIIEEWRNSKQFKFNPKTKKKIYSIDTPPPYINAPIHIGHATTYVYQDFFARYWRMKGYEVLFPLGLDRNGLPIEVGAEKKFGVSPFKIGRKEFLEYCKKLLEQTSLESTDTFAKLGISFNSYEKNNEIGDIYFTDDENYRALTQETFINLYKKGKIYEDTRINNWDCVLQTTIADSEIDYEDKESFFVKVKWKIKETGEEIVIGTTRPELICTCGMIIFNPKDKRYKKLKGKTAITPIFNKEIKIIEHPLAQTNKGTGLAMMCSAGDLSDIQFFREMALKPIIAIDKQGKMNENAGFLKGLKVKDARKKIIEELESKNLIINKEKVMHRTPISERSKTEIEFIEMPEFYLKQLDIKNKIKKLSKEKQEFFPKSARNLLNKWIDSITIDWPISRRRYYSTEIPLWHCKEENLVALPRAGKYYQPWNEKVPNNSEIYKNGKKIGNISEKNFKNKKWIGETRVFDTWFDSSISVLNILSYKNNKEFFKKAYPSSLRPQGKEIVRTWLYYSLLRCYLETGELPFKHIWIHNHILDDKGKKMSKSLGNVINPQELINEFGAEAFRLWAAEEGNLSKQDLMCSKQRIKAELKTINKIINVSKFVMLFEKPKNKIEITKLDKLFIDYIEFLTKEFEKSYNNYDFHNPSLKLRNFLWNIFASNYIELIKARAYNNDNYFDKKESDSAKYTLHYILERFLILIYPIIPQVTTLIAKEKNLNLLKIEFPKPKKITSDLKLIEKIIDFNSLIWKTKKEKGLSLKNEISGIKIPERLKDFEKELRITHNLK